MAMQMMSMYSQLMRLIGWILMVMVLVITLTQMMTMTAWPMGLMHFPLMRLRHLILTQMALETALIPMMITMEFQIHGQ